MKFPKDFQRDIYLDHRELVSDVDSKQGEVEQDMSHENISYDFMSAQTPRRSRHEVFYTHISIAHC